MLDEEPKKSDYHRSDKSVKIADVRTGRAEVGPWECLNYLVGSNDSISSTVDMTVDCGAHQSTTQIKKCCPKLQDNCLIDPTTLANHTLN
jgi:hypothetical protein